MPSNYVDRVDNMTERDYQTQNGGTHGFDFATLKRRVNKPNNKRTEELLQILLLFVCVFALVGFFG